MGERWLSVASVATLVSALLANGCGESTGASGARVSERDSAGIVIVENEVSPSAGPAALQLSPEPRLRIGAVEGPEAEQLFRVRGGVILPDGRVAVLNAGTRQVRVYGPDGAHLTSFGGAGEGPGEFGFPGQLAFLEPDTLMVWDSQTWRTTWFDLEGRVVAQDAGRTKYGRASPRVPSPRAASRFGAASRSGCTSG